MLDSEQPPADVFHFHLFEAKEEAMGPIAANLLSELEETGLESLEQITSTNFSIGRRVDHGYGITITSFQLN